MESQTFRIRVSELIQKSRKALRLYSSMGRIGGATGESSELSEIQVREWQDINSDLLKQLSLVFANPNGRRLAIDVCSIRDRFYSEWRSRESEVHQKQSALVSAAENSDFIKCATLSRELISLKARMQASQAAFQELEDLLRQSKVNLTTIELSYDKVLPDSPASDSITITSAKNADVANQPIRAMAKIIPLRKQS